MKECDHTWGPTIWDPLFYGKPTCFSGRPHVDRFVIFCTRCGIVKSWQKGDKDWKVIGRLSKAELFELVQERAQEVLEGRIEVDLNAMSLA
jgi:hypothetical protein